jgi:type II secretion system protein H
MKNLISGSIRSVAKRQGFTLLELCVVLFIMALLAGAAMPAMNSAFTEQALRSDSHELSVMVKTAMIKSREQGRSYVIRLDGKNLALEPAAGAVSSAPSEVGKDDADDDVPPEVISQTHTLGNVIKFPDVEKKNAWESLPSVTWTFDPAGLCPLPRVRLERGDAYIELSFNALTGDVEDESVYLK